MALTDSLISYWKLDEASGNALDAHGSNDLTNNNSVGATTGKVSGARDFERSAPSYFTHVDNADLSTGDIAFTFTAWVMLESKPGVNMIIVSKDNSADGDYFLYHKGSTDRFVFEVASTFAFGAPGIVSADTSGAPSTGVWYYVVAWHDPAANTLNIQVNDGAVDSSSHSAGVYDGNTTFYVGNDFYNSPFDGLIDEVGFWKRVLTPGERNSLYNGGVGLAYPLDVTLVNGLIVYYKLDEASGNAVDSHSSHNLTDVNSVGAGTGKINGARDFEQSSGQYFSHVSHSDLQAGDTDFTIQAWVKVESTGADRVIIARWSSTFEYILFLNGSTTFFDWFVHAGGSVGNAGAINFGTVPTATWCCVHCWHDAFNNQVGVSVNAGTPNLSSHSAGVQAGGSAFYLGAQEPGVKEWDGLLDEVGIWRRVLTSDERTALYNAGAGLAYPFGVGGPPAGDLDTRTKRASSVATYGAWVLSLPLADGTIGLADRQHAAGDYAGISSGPYVPPTAPAGAPWFFYPGY